MWDVLPAQTETRDILLLCKLIKSWVLANYWFSNQCEQLFAFQPPTNIQLFDPNSGRADTAMITALAPQTGTTREKDHLIKVSDFRYRFWKCWNCFSRIYLQFYKLVLMELCNIKVCNSNVCGPELETEHTDARPTFCTAKILKWKSKCFQWIGFFKFQWLKKFVFMSHRNPDLSKL